MNPLSSRQPPFVDLDARTLGMEEVEGLLQFLEEEGGQALRRLGFRTRLQHLARAATRFLDPADPLVREALARIPDEARLSAQATREVILGMARDWTLERLGSALRADFPDPDVLDGFRPGVRGDLHRAVPPRLLVQIGSGNVPGTSATALLRGLLVGAPTLLKPGKGDRVLPGLLAQAMAEESPELARGFAVVHWAGGEGQLLERRALARAERVVVYGGMETVEAVRAQVGPLVPVVVYGPRIGAGLVLRDATGADTSVEAAARAVRAYAQRGCVSPHLIWVETGGARSPEAWAEALARAFAEHRAEPLAGGRASEAPARAMPDEAAAMRALAEAAEYRAAAGGGDRVLGGPAQGWMVLWEPEARALEPSCLGHTVRVRPVAEAADVLPLLRPHANLLQSVAVEGGEPGRGTLALHLARVGVSRITTFRDQPWPPAWWKHDGEGPLRALVRWATLEPADPAGPA